MTAKVDEGIRDRCLRAGMDEVLAKPFKADALNEVLSRLVERPDERGE